MTVCVPPLGLPGVVTTARQVRARITAHAPMATNTWRMRIHAPEIAGQILPGQFFMVKAPDRSDPLLGRPFALFETYADADGNVTELDFGYIVIGKLTSLLTSLKAGDEVELWGPLGNGFPPPPAGHLVVVAGGIGQTPFLSVLREALGQRNYGRPVPTRPDKLTFCYGVRSASFLAGVEDFRLPGVDVRIATDDGSTGHKGYVTQLLDEVLKAESGPVTVYCCGPEPMLHAVAKLTAAASVPCLVSLETPMACGFGACFSCVTRVKQDDGTWDYRRVCVEGPVFKADELIWD